ncbi:MAG: NADH-quinone oxidoreductase subunit [Gaiellales bacterium]|jgi:NADH-quinone oxidoreductase subunit N|nr:NADH-quinone oxidoreductase subunit [Gaiellales bacterium]
MILAATTIPVSWSAVAPEVVLISCACVLLSVAIFLPERLAGPFSAIVAGGGFLGAMVAPIVQWDDPARHAFDGTLRIDAFGNGGRLLIFGAGLLAVLVAWGMPHLRDRTVEYHALLLAAGAGMSLLCVSNSLVILFIALELFSIALYALVAIESDRIPGLEGALKYLIVGSIGAAFLLYGSALVYGASGQFEFDRIAGSISSGPIGSDDAVLLLGIALILVGLGFKANSAPFHMWTPDAYEGAPTPVTAFMAAATKTVALVVLFRVLVTAFPAESDVWQTAIGGLAIASFVVGNLAALRQTNVKRMLAYSTVGHTGFLFTAVAASSSDLAGRALLYYLAVYALMNIGAFALVLVREAEIGRPVEIADFAGYGFRRPLLGIAMVVFMLSLAGFPPTGGFVGKLSIWSAAVDGDQTYLAVAGVVATVVALAYYLRIPFALYDRDAAPDGAARTSLLAVPSATVLATAIAVVLLGIIPGPLFDLAETASRSLTGG